MKHQLMIYGLCLMLVGCAGTPSGSGAEDSVQSMASATTERTITHAMGETPVPSDPQRVVVLTNEATDMVLALGITPVGAVKSWAGDPYYDYLADEMAEVPVVGDEMQPRLEQIVALQPDLIVGSKVRQEAIYDSLNAIAPTVFSETIGEPWQENLRLYGQALNREAEAEQLLADWETRVVQLRQRFADQAIQVSLVRFLPGMTRIYLKDSFPGQIVQDVGLQRPASQAEAGFAQEVSFEQIPQMEADVLFYFVQADNAASPDAVANPWLSHPLWQQLAVVQAGNAHAVSDVVWTTAGGIQAAHLLLDDLERYLQP
jgi:iron complex transport system substrate-binding protein